MGYDPKIAKYVPIDTAQLDEVIRGMDIIITALTIHEEDLIEAFEKAETLFDKDELGYIRGEYLERYHG